MPEGFVVVVIVGGCEITPNIGIVTCTGDPPVGVACCKAERVISAPVAPPDPTLVIWPVMVAGMEPVPEAVSGTSGKLLSAVPSGTLNAMVAL